MSDDGTQDRTDGARLAAEALRHLAWLADAGIAEVPPPAPRVTPPPPSHEHGANVRDARGAAPAGPGERPASERSLPAAGAPETGGRPPLQAAHREGAAGRALARYSTGDKGCGSPTLLAVREELGECARCKLAAGRTNLVFGVGAPQAELMFVGEGPGADEDLQGEPFVGRAGQLLTKMIEAMGHRREEVYIANVVKCRPPGNRNPEPDEMDACEPFLRRQIAAVRPKVIVALGKIAAQALLRDTTPISRLRGRWASYEGVRLMPTFHPAYLLRSPDEKKKAWEDLQLVMKELGKTVTVR